MRLRKVARVMPNSLAACTWFPLVSLSACNTNSRSTAGINFSFGSLRAHWKSFRVNETTSVAPPSPVVVGALETLAVALWVALWPAISWGKSLSKMASPFATTNARRTMFSNSRTLPGQ